MKKPKVISGEGVIVEGFPKKRISKITLNKGANEGN